MGGIQTRVAAGEESFGLNLQTSEVSRLRNY